METPNRETELKTLRELRGVSRVELAEAVGITPEALRAYEIGLRWPKLHCARAMADALDMTLDELHLALSASHAKARRQDGEGLTAADEKAPGLM